MANNPVNSILNRLPLRFSDGTVSRVIFDAIGEEIKEFNIQTENLYTSIGVLTSTGTDLDLKWGALIGVPRLVGESDIEYRNRMATSFSGLTGGTKESILFAAAVAIGVNPDSQFAKDNILVVDSWDHTGILPNTGPGYGICIINWDATILGEYEGEPKRIKLENFISTAKAFGIRVYTIINLNIISYTDLENKTYISLDNIRYGDLGRVI